MVESEESLIEYELENFLNYLKRKLVVSFSDLEPIYLMLGKTKAKLEELRKSRDNWRNKYEELLAKT